MYKDVQIESSLHDALLREKNKVQNNTILLAIFSKEDTEIKIPWPALTILRKIPEMTNSIISEGGSVG